MTGFSETQRAEMQEMITAAIRTAMSMQPAPVGPPGPPGPPGPAGLQGPPTANGGAPMWNASEVGVFHPDMDDSLGKGPIVHTSRETYFRDVHLFCDRMNDMVKIKGLDLIRQNVWQCLRGSALEWYTAILTDMEKRLLATGGNDLSEWTNALTNRFAENPAEAMKLVLKESYSWEDA